jgi:hypothetical protein
VSCPTASYAFQVSARRDAELARVLTTECDTIGDPRTKTLPDLAVEVVWTSGRIDKLEITRATPA